MNAPYKAIDISSYFINKGVTPLKIQKLLYYSQVWYFVKYGKKLFSDNLQAWIYGPVVYDVWNNFRFIKRSAFIPKSKINQNDFSDIKDHLDDVWNAYGHLSGSQLVDLTHSELPWKNSRKGKLSSEPSNNSIIIDKYTTADFTLTNNYKIPKVNMPSTFGQFSNM